MERKRVSTRLDKRTHAEFIKASRLNGDTMSGAFAKFAKLYIEQTKENLFDES